MFLSSSQHKQPTSGKFLDRKNCRKTRNIRPVPLETLNQDVYKGVLQHLRDSIRRRRPELWATRKWFLLHDNARPHKTSSVKELLPVHQITVTPHVLYSPDVILRFFVFPLLKWALKSHRYVDIPAFLSAVTKQLCCVPESYFQDCFKDLQKRWKRPIDAGGSHFESYPYHQNVSKLYSFLYH